MRTSQKPPTKKVKAKVKKNRPGFRGYPCDIGRKILEALARAGLNGHDLAARLGVSDMTVTRWISGECGISFLNQIQLRKLLGAGVC